MSRTITRRSFTGIALLAGGSVVAACNSDAGSSDSGQTSAADAETGDSALETTTLSIGLSKDPGLASQMIAIDKGFLEEEGFTEIETTSYDAGALAGEALAAGEINLWGTSTNPPISMRHNGVPIVITGTAASGWSEKLVVRDDVTLETPEDLTKIKIGALTGATDTVIANLERLNGLDAGSLQTVNLAPADQMVALAEDEVQAIMIWNPWPEQFQVQNPGVPVTYYWEQNTSYFPWADGEEMRASHARLLFCLREDWISQNPNSAAAMMRALFNAQAWISDTANTDEAIDIFVKYTEYDKSLIEAIWGDYTFDPSLDQEYVEDLNAYTDAAVASGAIGDKQDPLSYTYSDLLADYDPSKVQVEGGWQP
ncbi:MAG: ABC transporter substrate-binding protein [Beutenbergiaceae bacterium]